MILILSRNLAKIKTINKETMDYWQQRGKKLGQTNFEGKSSLHHYQGITYMGYRTSSSEVLALNYSIIPLVELEAMKWIFLELFQEFC